MAVCYDKLWKLLIDKKLNKAQLCEQAKVTTYKGLIKPFVFIPSMFS